MGNSQAQSLDVEDAPLLKDRNWSIRKRAWRILEELPVDKLVKWTDHLVPLLKDEHCDVRGTACRILGQLPADELVKLKHHIFPLLKDADLFVCGIACVTVEKLPADELVGLTEDIVLLLKDQFFVGSKAWEILQKLPAKELLELKDHIIPHLKDECWTVRHSACLTLRQLPADEVVKLKDHILPLMKDENQYVRSRACETLATLSSGELVELKHHIVPLLKDADVNVRKHACALLWQLPADELVKLSDHRYVSTDAKRCLYNLPAYELLKLSDNIAPLLKDGDSNVCRHAWYILGKLQADELVKLKDHILPLLRDEHCHVRLCACETLATLSSGELVELKHHILPLLKDADVNVRKHACASLGKLPVDELVESSDHIVPLLKDTSETVRSSACETLGKLPSSQLVKLRDQIIPCLKDADVHVRKHACASLGKLPADELVKLSGHIVPLLKDRVVSDTDLDVCRIALALFGRLELTKDLISLVEKLRPALLLHFAAAVGDWPACFLLIRCGFSLEEKDRDGRTPSEIARRVGHLDLAEKLKSDFLNTKGGSGMAIARALQDDSQIEAVSWYTMPLSGWACQVGGLHSVLVVKANDFCYAIERARPYHGGLIAYQKDEIQQGTKKGLFVSDWEEVSFVPQLVQLEKVTPLQGIDIKCSISPKTLVTHLLRRFDGYDVGSNNCHHTAMEAFNFCTDTRQLMSLPVNLWQSRAAKFAQFLGSDLATGRLGSGSASEPLYNDVIRHPIITGSKPTAWLSNGKSKPYLQEVDKGSEQYDKVRNFVMRFGGSEIQGFVIQKIHRNEHFGSYEKYVHNLKDKSAQHEYCWLFHGPGQAGFQKIVMEGRGFDDDFRSMTFAAYGQGHYFAHDFRLADFFADGRGRHKPHEMRRVLLCRVAAGKPFDAERLFPYVPRDPTSGRSDTDWTKKMEEFNKSKPQGHDNSWIGNLRELIVGKGEMVYVDYVVEYTSAELAGNPYVDPLMSKIRTIPRPMF